MAPVCAMSEEALGQRGDRLLGGAPSSLLDNPFSQHGVLARFPGTSREQWAERRLGEAKP